MKFFNLTVAVIAIVTLSACSKTPSDSDVKKVIQKSIGDCSYFSIDSFEKTNGIADGDSAYRVEVKYSIKMKPLEENKKDTDEVVEVLKKFEADTTGVQERIEKYSRAEGDYVRERFSVQGDHYAQYRLDHPSEYAQYQKDTFLLSNVNAATYQFQGYKQKFSTRLYNVCPHQSGIEMDFFNPNDPKIRLVDYAKDVVKSYTATIQMIKTDNGWEERR